MAYTDVNYAKVGWLNTPSTDTPINATNLGNMDNGIEACANRANASVPFDNILSLAEAQSVTVRNTYVLDAVDSAKIASRIGANTITYESGEYYIKADDGVKKKLLSNGLWYIGDTSVADEPNKIAIGKYEVPDCIKSKVDSSSFFFVLNRIFIDRDSSDLVEVTLSPSFDYDGNTGIVELIGYDYFSAECIYYATGKIYAFA